MPVSSQKVATLNPGHNDRGWFFSAKKKGESRYEETIPDRSAARGATVPPVGPRTESQHSDDFFHGRSGRPFTRRGGSLAARSRTDADELNHGGGSAAPGGGAPSTAPRASRPPLGERGRLLRSGRAEGTDSENAVA